MKLKLDENLGVLGQAVLRAEKHDVSTVLEQNLQAAHDQQIADACRRELRVLITLDLDFANPLRFRPHETPGIAVLRIPGKASHKMILELVQTLAIALRNMDIDGKLWVVEPGRIRVHET